MTTVTVTLGGYTNIPINSASVRKSITSINATADISSPINVIPLLQVDQEIAIEVDNVVLFHGLVADYSLSYSGGVASVSIPCCDLSYRLTHMLAREPSTEQLRTGTLVHGNTIAVQLELDASDVNDAYTGLVIQITGGTGAGQSRKIFMYTGSSRFAAITPAWDVVPNSTSTYRMCRGYAEGTDIGVIVADLLENTGIVQTRVNQDTGIKISLLFEPNSLDSKMDVINSLTAQYNCLFWLSYGKLGSSYKTFGEFDTYYNITQTPAFLMEHTITPDACPVFDMSIARNAGANMTRAVARRDVAGVLEIGIATIGDPPYLDIITSVGESGAAPIRTISGPW